MSITMKAALAYIRAGLSVIPIRCDGTKALALPSGTRAHFEQRIATVSELEGWFVKYNLGIAILGGKVSGNLECIDFDLHAEKTFPAWCDLIETENKELLSRLVINRTPRPGYHVIYRTDGPVAGSVKLASIPWLNPETQKEERATMIETRGEGGYFVAPGSPAKAHENGRPWEWHAGRKLSQVQTITQAERGLLLQCARSFNRNVAEFQSKAQPVAQGIRPGDDFNARGPDWSALLEPHGWTVQHTRGDARYWRRPGKQTGISATTGICKGKDNGSDLLYVFSTNADPFESEHAYAKFTVYAMLHHASDWVAAARKLGEDGYGEQKPKPDPLVAIANEIRRDAAKLKPTNRQEYLEALEEIGVRVIKGLDFLESVK